MKKYSIIAREKFNLFENTKSVVEERTSPFHACRKMMALAAEGYEYISVINQETKGLVYEYKRGEKREGFVDGIITCNVNA